MARNVCIRAFLPEKAVGEIAQVGSHNNHHRLTSLRTSIRAGSTSPTRCATEASRATNYRIVDCIRVDFTPNPHNNEPLPIGLNPINSAHYSSLTHPINILSQNQPSTSPKLISNVYELCKSPIPVCNVSGMIHILRQLDYRRGLKFYLELWILASG